MAARVDKVKGGIQYRNAELQRASFNKDGRTVRCIISTENPVRTAIGWKIANEVLTHDDTAVDLTFARQGAPLLRQHDTDCIIGVIESVEIKDRKLEAMVRFSKSAAGEAAMADVEDNITRFMSIGYRVFKYEVDEDEENYRATQWKLLEASIVSIPADPSARIQRSEQDQHEIQIMNRSHINREAAPATGGGGAPAILPSKEDFTREMDEAREIMAITAQYQRTHPKVADLCEKALKDKMPIKDFSREVMGIISTRANTDLSAPAIGAGTAPTHRGPMSLGARFVNSEAYKNGAKRRSVKGIQVDFNDEYQFRADMGMSTRVNFGIGTSDVSGSTDIGGTGGANIDQQKPFNLLNQQPLGIADLFSQGATGSDVIRYIRELTSSKPCW